MKINLIKLLLVLLCTISCLEVYAAEWYRIVAEGSLEQMVDYKKTLLEKGSAVTNPKVVQYNGKIVVMTGPYSDDRVNQIKQNYINKNIDLNQLAFFQLASQPKDLESQPRSSGPNPGSNQLTQAPQRQAPPTQPTPRQSPPTQPAPVQSAPMTMSDIICQTHEMIMLNQILPFRQQGIMGVGEAQNQFNSEDDAGTRVFLKQYVRQLYADPAWGEKTLRSGQFLKACAKVHRGY
ncbi:hypothetical protein G6712_06080 [Polynucleobacter paneuropaeus]|nr:hypothetical protein [Polynucleobacter paneuropaeus]